MLFGDIKRAVASDTDVILFNIDSKADSRAGRDAMLAVFLKVLNEMQGYSGIVVVLMPNGTSYYYASDGRDFTWNAAVREADKITLHCP